MSTFLCFKSRGSTLSPLPACKLEMYTVCRILCQALGVGVGFEWSGRVNFSLKPLWEGREGYAAPGVGLWSGIATTIFGISKTTLQLVHWNLNFFWVWSCLTVNNSPSLIHLYYPAACHILAKSSAAGRNIFSFFIPLSYFLVHCVVNFCGCGYMNFINSKSWAIRLNNNQCVF